jgi:hypothetical protein
MSFMPSETLKQEMADLIKSYMELNVKLASQTMSKCGSEAHVLGNKEIIADFFKTMNNVAEVWAEENGVVLQRRICEEAAAKIDDAAR